MGFRFFGGKKKLEKLKKAAADMPTWQGGRRPGKNAQDQRYGAAHAYMAVAEREGWDLSLEEALAIVDGD